MLDRATIVTAARLLMGTPFRHQGRSPDGVDCIGLIVLSLMQAGWLPLNPETALLNNYRKVPDSDTLVQAILNEADQIGIEDVQPADMLLFRWHGQPRPQHVALVTEVPATGNVYIIHTRRTVGKVVEHHLAPEFRVQVVSAWRLKVLSFKF